ncbi:MAG TPA: efflux RND transporter periplasmic adaptor subunit [Opitutaceae bacterium]|nr:efflux RND transporter periplasmic adaptor subunit [Opitutaceae bacterium]
MSAPSNNSRLALKLLVVVGVLVAAGIFFRGAFLPVAKVAVVSSGLAVNSVPGSVLVASERPGLLTSEIGGRILKSDIEPGKNVREGEILVQIDTGDIDLEIEKIQIDLDAMKKKVAAGSSLTFEYDTAAENLENAQRQNARGSLSDQELARFKRAVDAVKLRQDQEFVSNKQAIDSLDNLLRVKQRNRAKMTIRAPFDGVIASVNARKDDQVSNNQTIANLITLRRNVEAKISEENFAEVQIGQRAVVRFVTYGDERFDGKVIRKLPAAELGTQRYIAHLDVKIDPAKLLPDLTGDVSIIIDERQSQTRIPRRALTLIDKVVGYVLVVKDGRVERRKVKAGYTAENLAEILEGVSKGEQVIVDNLDQFKDGDQVRVEISK